MCRNVLGSVLLALVSLPAAAQDVREHDIGGRALAFHDNVRGKILSYPGSPDAIGIVTTIMGKVGLPMNLDVRAAPKVPNAEALIEEVDGKQVRVILYNPTWMGNLTQTLMSDWPSTSIMAHEIG